MHGSADNLSTVGESWIPGEPWIPDDEEDRRVVREELARLLASDEIKSSKRYISFLTFGVEHSLLHRSEGLKERTVGIGVFGRAPDYDTSSDPIVRVTATELRKRIAHYYSNPANHCKLHILLPTGSYIPVFIRSQALAPMMDAYAVEEARLGRVSLALEVETVPRSLEILSLPKSHAFGRRLGWLLALTAVVVGVSWLVFEHYGNASSSLDAFWLPFMNSKGPVLICIADQPPKKIVLLSDADNPLRQTEQNTTISQRPASVALADTVPLLTVANLMHAKGREYRVQGQASVTLADLRQGPIILIGAYDNVWTLRLTQGLRFHFANDPEMSHMWIRDRNNPERRTWMRDIPPGGKALTYTDYALVARFLDPSTNQITIVAAGLGDSGTAAAGEVLSNSDVLNQLQSASPNPLDKKNVEMVIATNVIEGHHSSARILAVDTW